MVKDFGTPTRRRRHTEIRKSSPIQDLIKNSSPIKFLRSRKGRGASFFVWIALIGFGSAFRVLWQSVTFTRQLTAKEDYFYAFDINAGTKATITRDKRVRPRIGVTYDAPIADDAQATKPTTFASLEVQIPDAPHKVQGLCGKLHGEESRILISGILTHPLGVELTLFLSNECGVEKIHGISEHDMNPESYKRLSFVLKRVPKVEIHLSEPTNSGPNSETLSRIFSELVPTHVVHLEALSFLPPDLQLKPTMTAVRNSLNKIERLCEAMTKQSTLGLDVPEMIYVTSSSAIEQNEHASFAMKNIIPMLMRTYTSKYSTRVSHLRLPTVFGPMEESRMMLDAALNANATKLPPPSNLIHIAEAVFLTVSCVTSTKYEYLSDFGLESIPSFEAGRSHIQSLHAIVSALKSLSRGKEIRNKKREGSYLEMLSWYHKDAHPFAKSNTTDSKTRQALEHSNGILTQAERNNSLVGISQSERRTFNIFPCASECATSHTPCLSSQFDESLTTLAKNLTYDCRYVVYLTDFSESLQDLPLLRNITESNVVWPSEQVCELAFVSSRSKLVKDLMRRDGVTLDAKKSWLAQNNGMLSSNRWKLLWPNQNVGSLLEGDYMMPKIAPGSFMSHNVSKAVYLEPEHIRMLPSLPILWFLMSKQLDQRKIPGRDKIVRRSGTSVETTLHIPGVPAKHVALFSHWFPTQEYSTAGSMAKDVLDQKGIGWERSWPFQQMSFYDYAMRDYEFLVPDTFLLVHNLRSDRSRRLRCEWYEEQLFWASEDEENRSRDLEDISLAFVLATWRSEGRLIPGDESWGERMLTDGEINGKKEDEEDMSSQYFIKMHRPMSVRRQYQAS